jgi:D-beta-D-heptose 7-phosphate kinase/D-beta-D-heptose 1-phosphate adenosyltransferase
MSMDHAQQVFRFDEESTHLITSDTEETLLNLLRTKIRSAQVVLCSDYLKGLLTPNLLKNTFALAQQHGLPVVVGPKDSNPTKYQGASVLIPNMREFQQLSRSSGNETQSLTQAAGYLLRRSNAKSVLVTRGQDGMSLFENGAGSLRRVDIPTEARSVYDVTGAGDTVASVFTLAIAAGANYETAARLANLAAGIVVEKVGSACVTPAEVLERAEHQDIPQTNRNFRTAGLIPRHRSVSLYSA